MWHSRPRLCELRLKANKYDYRRNLPHIKKDNRPHFVTFITYKRWILPEAARDIVLNSCLHLNGRKMKLHAAVVMPEHVHMICSMLQKANEGPYTFAEILNPIKGYSAHRINELLHRKGRVWLDESLDHVLRSQEKLDTKIEYLRQNPVHRGLVKHPLNIDGCGWIRHLHSRGRLCHTSIGNSTVYSAQLFALSLRLSASRIAYRDVCRKTCGIMS